MILYSLCFSLTDISPSVVFYRFIHVATREREVASRVWLFATQWAVAHQSPPFMEFARQEYWSGLPFPSPGDLPNPGVKPRSPALQADALPSEPPGPCCHKWKHFFLFYDWVIFHPAMKKNKYAIFHICTHTHVYVYVYTHTHTHCIFFTQSSGDGYLCCLQVLAIKSSAVMNIGVHVSFQIRVLLFLNF